MAQSNTRRVLLVSRAIIQNHRGELLLVKRAEDDTRNPGLWEFPGGKVEPGQTLTQGLNSEISEETGLYIEKVSPLSYVDSHVIPDGKYRGLTYVAVFGIAKIIAGTIQLSPEHSAYTWESCQQANRYDLTVESRNALNAMTQYILQHGTESSTGE